MLMVTLLGLMLLGVSMGWLSLAYPEELRRCRPAESLKERVEYLACRDQQARVYQTQVLPTMDLHEVE